MSNLLRFCSNGNLRQVRGVLSTTTARSLSTTSASSRVAAPTEVIGKYTYRFAVGGNWTESADKKKVQVLKTAHTKTIRPTAERSSKDVVIPEWSREEVSALVHDVVSNVSVSEYEQVKFEEPVTRAPGRLGSKPLTTNNQVYRAKLAKEQSILDIAALRAEWTELVTVPKIDSIKSSPAAPLAFGENNFLKFAVLDAVMKKTGVTISSSHLGNITNVEELIAALVETRDKLVARKAKTAAEFPTNVAFVVESTANVLKSIKGRNQRKLVERKEREARK